MNLPVKAGYFSFCFLPSYNQTAFFVVFKKWSSIDKGVNYRFNPQRGYYCIITG